MVDLERITYFLRHVASKINSDLVVGVLLYAGTHTLVIDDKLIAVPLSAIWEAPQPDDNSTP